jgi:hypothetical protein
MNSSWSNLYDRVKDRRYGMVFLLAPLMIFFLLGSLATAIYRTLFWRREPSNFSRLSSDELAKARSKLLNDQRRKML